MEKCIDILSLRNFASDIFYYFFALSLIGGIDIVEMNVDIMAFDLID
ncbi:hypothetical protein GWN15_11700 [candidate division KSB1 bacterium]|nr:hypothetical protein [candidate division KSB1 bacterium]NIW69550.1 hypothetical protein [candidate division KSB1 bacterium]